jgi:hypothetical protein
MEKYCTLKDMVPGSVVKLPDERLALIFGLEYSNAKDTDIFPTVLRVDGNTLIPTSLPSQPETTKFALSDSKILIQRVKQAFATHTLALPSMKPSMGCDPEIFVVHGDGTLFPAWEFLPSEEESNKKKLEWMLASNEETGHSNALWADEGNNNQIPQLVPSYWDGAQAEFAPWAKHCLETLHGSTKLGLHAVLAAARKIDPQAKLTVQNVFELPNTILKNADIQYIRFRCKPSYNVYGDLGGELPDGREYAFRCAGGHIHIGLRKFTLPSIEQIIRALDGVLGVIGVSLAAGLDNPERRRTYGRAGEFRLPDYGIEYRVLSNFWLTHPAISMLVFELARVIIRFAESGLFRVCWLADEKETRDVINNCDVTGARKILERNTHVLAGLLSNLWQEKIGEAKMRKTALDTILNGMEVVVKDPTDVEGNWNLGKESKYCQGQHESWNSTVHSVKA